MYSCQIPEFRKTYFLIYFLYFWKKFTIFHYFLRRNISFRIQNIPFRYEAKQAKQIYFFLAISCQPMHRPSKCTTFYGAQHIFSPAKLFQNMISKSVYHICTTAGVIRVKR